MVVYDYNITITIGCMGENESHALEQVSNIITFIKQELPDENYEITTEKVGEYIGL